MTSDQMRRDACEQTYTKLTSVVYDVKRRVFGRMAEDIKGAYPGLRNDGIIYLRTDNTLSLMDCVADFCDLRAGNVPYEDTHESFKERLDSFLGEELEDNVPVSAPAESSAVLHMLPLKYSWDDEMSGPLPQDPDSWARHYLNEFSEFLGRLYCDFSWDSRTDKGFPAAIEALWEEVTRMDEGRNLSEILDHKVDQPISSHGEEAFRAARIWFDERADMPENSVNPRLYSTVCKQMLRAIENDLTCGYDVGVFTDLVYREAFVQEVGEDDMNNPNFFFKIDPHSVLQEWFRRHVGFTLGYEPFDVEPWAEASLHDLLYGDEPVAATTVVKLRPDTVPDFLVALRAVAKDFSEEFEPGPTLVHKKLTRAIHQILRP